ncbi:kinase-like protein [Gymnopus androsaceus JB14]|uniref:Kinase-like protein n=1 Tax=Gymnopus androsaceus JB14 TaxID=1447944 RepID=A0A6A4I6M3_9AGAR|nr:kinase-like protein [Gymnopus androsaceus JB14]
MKERCKNLDVVAVTLDYYLHRSAVPSFFVRCKQTSEGKIRSLPVRPSYSLDSCLRLDLKQRIGGGAIGTTYRATLTIGSDSTRCEDVVVKLANNDDRSRKHLRHEFSIYEHLARAKVQAVPHLYGLFEDVESENSQLILVTSYAGESLAVIHMSRYGRTSTSGTVLIPKAEQPVFLHQLAEIHEAGIHHRDLRPPNIVVDHDGKITFIDFDKARSYVTGKQRKHERKRLLNLMNGRYVDYDRTSLRSSGAQCSDCSSDDDWTWEALQLG